MYWVIKQLANNVCSIFPYEKIRHYYILLAFIWALRNAVNISFSDVNKGGSYKGKDLSLNIWIVPLEKIKSGLNTCIYKDNFWKTAKSGVEFECV